MINLSTYRSGGVEILCTEQGVELYRSSQELQELVGCFVRTHVSPENCLIEFGQHVGTGEHSEVFKVDGVAVKASTKSSGRSGYKYGGLTTGAENLCRQLTFMDGLGEFLRTRGIDMVTPQQYFALRSGSGFLLAQQYMEDWTTLFAWARKKKFDRGEEGDLYETVKHRINSEIGNYILRFGLHDLGLTRTEPLHAENVLIPVGTTTAPNEATLCIIDQPSRGIRGLIGYIGVKLANSARHNYLQGVGLRVAS